MAKIEFDKYYTSPILAKWCIEKTYEIIGKENITEIVEPSAGSGSFSHQILGCKAYDLYPQHEFIEQHDFLTLDLGGYKKGRLFIGNPPFGSSQAKILTAFYKKCCKDGDYIAFILPSQFHNNYRIFNKFEIVYSKIVKSTYTNIDLYTSFVIYKRNPNKQNFKNEIKTKELQDIIFTKLSRKNGKDKHKCNLDYDYCFTTFGQIMKESKPYKTAGQYIVKIKNEKLRQQILTCLKWLYIYNRETDIFNMKCVSSPNVSIHDVITCLKICIPELK
jgi:hypothetical protein